MPVPAPTPPARPAPRAYRAFGLAVRSDLPLPGFPIVPDGAPGTEPDVTVRQAPVSEADVVATNDSGDRVGTAPAGVFRALVEHGRRIIVDPEPEADPDFVGAVVTGELFAALLRQRGLLVLHGSAVAKDGVAAGFVGHSGWGKSTLAAALVGRGWRLLTDDLLVVDGVDPARPAGAPCVVPGHPAMRLAPEAAAHVEAGAPGGALSGPAAHTYTTKLQTDWDGAFHSAPVPLRHVFVLDPTPAGAPESVRPPLHVAALELAHHTRVRRLLAAPAYRAAHLAQCSALARAVPVAHLRRRFGLDHLDALCDHVEAAVAEAAAAAEGPAAEGRPA